MKRTAKVLLSPYSIALVIAVAIILLLPPIFDKYKVTLVNSETIVYSDGLVQYVDLDNDGYSEKIISFYAPTTNHNAIQIFDKEGGVLEQWNLKSKYTPRWNERIMYGDYDNDNNKELYIFTQKENSIFLSCISEMDGTFSFENKYIISISKKYSEILDYRICFGEVVDITNDGYPDLLFSINGGLSQQPRQIFIYDVKNDNFIRSKSFGKQINNFKLIDLDNDGKKEIIGDCDAAGNVDKSKEIYLHDYSAWLMVYNHNLELLFDPIEFPGFRMQLYVCPVNIGENRLICAYKYSVGPEPNYPVLYLFDINGNIVKEKRFPESAKIFTEIFVQDNLSVSNDEFYLIRRSGKIEKYNCDFELINTYQPVNESIATIPYLFDLNPDGHTEYIFQNLAATKFFITTDKFDYPVEINFPQDGSLNVTYKQVGEGYSELVIQKGKLINYYQYARNPLFNLKFLIYIGIYLGLLAFIILIRKLQQIQMREKNDLHNEISQLQLQTIRNQMDPHFTFNVFSSIASMIKKEKKEVAYDSFLKFSKLVRSTLESSDKITRSISEEISFVKNFLDLEKLRHGDKFNYEISINKNTDQNRPIPKMVLQTYVENAVKHGLRHKETGGILSIEIKTENNNLLLIVEDNGIGRAKAAEISNDSTGKGLEIMEHYFTLFNKYNNTKITHEIVDLTDADGRAAGTKVVVTIPRGFRYKLGVGGSR